MARVGAPYLPIRPAGHKPAPVPYFHELMKAQNMLPVGIPALAASAGDDDKKKKIPSTYVESTPAMPPEDPEDQDDLPRPPEKKEVPSNIEEREKFYEENVGYVQRGEPEEAMLKATMFHSGALSET